MTSMNNWKLILTELLNGPRGSTYLRQVIYETRNPGETFNSHVHRGQYTWYFGSHSSWRSHSTYKKGLDYGYIESLGNGQFQITEKGRQYLNNVHVPGYSLGHREGALRRRRQQAMWREMYYGQH